jgi:hypothetical protein
MCLRCVLRVCFAWRFKNVTSGAWSVALFFSTLFGSAIQFTMAAGFLVSGTMYREFLRREVQKFAPWLRAFGLANSALGMSMAVSMAGGHTILAALIAFLGLRSDSLRAWTLPPYRLQQAHIRDRAFHRGPVIRAGINPYSLGLAIISPHAQPAKA